MVNDSDNQLTEDQKLILKICNGNEKAFEGLYKLHVDKMLGLAITILKNKSDAQDVIHDVFIEIWHKASSYNPKKSAVLSWLFLRVRSRSLDKIRMMKTVLKFNVIQEHEPLIDNDNETHYLHNKQNEGINNALDLLSEKQRNVIQLSYFKGLTCAEIARDCDIPLGTVKTRMMSAMAILKSSLITKELI